MRGIDSYLRGSSLWPKNKLETVRLVERVGCALTLWRRGERKHEVRVMVGGVIARVVWVGASSGKKRVEREICQKERECELRKSVLGGG